MDLNHRRNQLLSIGGTALLLVLLYLANAHGDNYEIRILNNCAIFIILAVSYNLINGVTGQFSLEPNAFVAIGAYTSALLTLTPLEKEISFIIEPCIWPLSVITTPFVVSLVIAGVVTAFCGFLMGFPVFRVRGDYLAIVTLGFGEVVRVIANNTQSITNGPLGLKGIAENTNIWWSWGFAIVTVFYISRLVRSSYGMAMKAIKYDEAAAEAVGINAFWHKMLAFTTSAFFEGVGGGSAGPPHHDDLAGALHLLPDLQPADHHRGGRAGEHHGLRSSPPFSLPGGANGSGSSTSPSISGSSKSPASPACAWSSFP